jgi:hypothetical protein
MGTFSASIKDWATKTEDELTVIMREAVEDTVVAIGLPFSEGGPMPVDIGFLRNSMAADINGEGSFATVKPAFHGDRGAGTGAAELVISNMPLGSIAHVAWTAVYAARVNYGFVGQDSLGRNYFNGGAHFLEIGAETWPGNVDRAVNRNTK